MTVFRFLLLILCCVLTISLVEGQNNLSRTIGQHELLVEPVELGTMEQVKSAKTNNSKLLKDDEVHRGEMSCNVLWQKTIWGECMGENANLIPYDYQKDGTIEFITNGYIPTTNAEHNGYWAIVQFDPVSETYSKVYESALFDKPISKMLLVNVGVAHSDELLILVDNTLQLIDMETFEVIRTAELGNFHSRWEQIKYINIDDDVFKEIVVGSNGRLFILNAALEIEKEHDVPDGYFDIANVDDDPLLELFFSTGTVYEIDLEGNLDEEYQFEPISKSTKGQVILEDIDMDGYAEAIWRNANSNISVYDVEAGTSKQEVEVFGSIDAFILYDVNDDGQKDVVCGTGFGEIAAYDLEDGSVLWKDDGIRWSNDVNSLAMGDFDGDDEWEIVLGTACGSSRNDELFVLNRFRNIEWRSNVIKGGFRDIEVVDIEQDGRKEIITLSVEQYNETDGVVTIYDAVTKEVKNEFWLEEWGGFHIGASVEVADYDRDGDLDIIVVTAADARVRVIDGLTKEVIKEKSFEDTKMRGLGTLVVEDIDQDGNLELITSNGDKLYILNKNLEVEWNSVTLNNTFQYFTNDLLVGNVDEDEGDEIVFCNGFIYRFDDEEYRQRQTDNNEYTAITLLDWDDSGDMEIIAGSKRGYIHILDGSSLELISELPFGNYHIDGIQAADFNQDGKDELLVTADEYLFVVDKEGNAVRSGKLDVHLGMGDAIVVEDYDDNGYLNLLVGSNYGVFDIDAICTKCLWFEPILNTVDASCGLDNGQLLGESVADGAYFTWESSNFIDQLDNLAEGKYTVQALSIMGCKMELEREIKQHDLTFRTSTIHNKCPEDQEGMIEINVEEGKAPYEFLWSNGATTSFIEGLSGGDYVLTITDSNACVKKDTIRIEAPDSMTFTWDYLPDNPETADPEGLIGVEVAGGTEPYTYYWSNGRDEYWINNVATGTYTLTVTDNYGCQQVGTIYLGNPATGVDLATNPDLQAYPNPTSDDLYLEYTGSHPIQSIKLYTIQGKECLNQPINLPQQEKIQLDLSMLQTGIYFLVIEIDQQLYYKQIEIL